MISNTSSIPIIDPNTVRAEITVPQALRETLEANKHLVPFFLRTIQHAIQYSFEHPDTCLKGEIKQNEIKLRMELCYDALEQMHHEHNLTLLHSLDLLPSVIIDALRMASSTREAVGDNHGDRWTVPEDQGMILTADLNSDINAVSTASETGDLSGDLDTEESDDVQV